jgi:hypothetical protein
MLEHHVDWPSIWREPTHRSTADPDVTDVGRQKPCDDAQQRRLAASRWPEDRKEAAVRYREGQRIDGRLGAVALTDAVNFKILPHRRYR